MTKASRMFRKQNRNLAILTPLDVEKWADFSFMMFHAPTNPSACQGDHRVTRAILSEIPGINVNGTIDSFKKLGGYCDCEVLSNAMRHLEREYNGTCHDCYFKNGCGEEPDPDCPKCKGLHGPCTYAGYDYHNNKHKLESRTAKKLTG